MPDENKDLPVTKRYRSAFFNHIKFKADTLEALDVVIGKDFAVMSFLYPVDASKAKAQLDKWMGNEGYKVHVKGLGSHRIIIDNRV
jgi:hypothetical protein